MPDPLTVRKVEAFIKAAPKDKRKELADAAMPGMRLLVFPSGHVSWQLQYRIEEERRKYTLRTYGPGEMSLAAAREAAREAKALVRNGICPKASAERSRFENAKSEKRARQLAEDTLNAVFDDYIEDKLRSKELRSVQELRRLFRTKVGANLGGRPIHQITREELRKLLRKIVQSGAPVSANRVHSLLRPLFSSILPRLYQYF
ncbi:Putative prophage CPS-53 integrase [Roseibium album]|nr:Putative prophage CPS-53 integrase [Roseibium album]